MKDKVNTNENFNFGKTVVVSSEVWPINSTQKQIDTLNESIESFEKYRCNLIRYRRILEKEYRNEKEGR